MERSNIFKSFSYFEFNISILLWVSGLLKRRRGFGKVFIILGVDVVKYQNLVRGRWFWIRDEN